MNVRIPADKAWQPHRPLELYRRSMSRQSGIISCTLFVAMVTTFGQGVKPDDASSPVSFVSDVAPILAKKCVACHGPEKAKGHFRLDSFDRLMTGGDSKSASIVPA